MGRRLRGKALMASGPTFPHSPNCNCGVNLAAHASDCLFQVYRQGFMDGTCEIIGKHLYLEHLDGECARCGRLESGTIPS